LTALASTPSPPSSTRRGGKRGFGESRRRTSWRCLPASWSVSSWLLLEQAFTTLLEQAERPRARPVASIRYEVMGGASFSDALSRHPRDFAEIYRALVASGEQIGQLSRVLSRLADYIERSNALIQKVRLAFIYPGIVTVVAFAIVIFLLTYVVPQIVSGVRQHQAGCCCCDGDAACRTRAPTASTWRSWRPARSACGAARAAQSRARGASTPGC
jgi:hypothetical protein